MSHRREPFDEIMFRCRKQPNLPALAATMFALAYITVEIVSASDLSSLRDIVASSETKRIEMIERVSPSVVCIYDRNLRGGGSGVLIDAEGYGLTNYHVVAGLMDSRRGWGGLGDGVLYELEVLGIDVTGDVAMFRLVPPKSEHKFPFARLGDSNRVRVGDTAVAMGNPFILSEDYTPTVTMGIVTGVHRYQWGVKGNLTYSDCLQIDTPINPGSSGGPLFNADGDIIGINGRISVNTRGRFNVGFGYAIATRQIKRFLPALRAGLPALHGTWHARVEEKDRGLVTFAEVRPRGPAHEAGIRVGDRLLSLDGVRMGNANQVVSILGTYPAAWPVVATIERNGQSHRVVLRLDDVQPKMREPFRPDREVNLRQIRRLLGRFQQAAGRLENPGRFRQWKWMITREHHPTADGSSKACETFEMSQSGEGRARMRQPGEGGAADRWIEYDTLTATQRVGTSEESFDLPIDQRMILGALDGMRRWLMKPVEELDLSEVSHVGGDAFVALEDPQAEPSEDSPPGGSRREQILEVLERSVADQAVARFGFDADTFLGVRITVRDRLSGAKIVIDLSDHRDVSGVVWPCTHHVYGAGHDYRDTLTDWELAP